MKVKKITAVVSYLIYAEGGKFYVLRIGIKSWLYRSIENLVRQVKKKEKKFSAKATCPDISFAEKVEFWRLYNSQSVGRKK